MIEVTSLKTLFSGKNIVQAIETLQDGMTPVVTERILLKPRVVLVTHDVVNDKTVLLHQYKVGAMSYTSEFPSGEINAGENPYDAVKRILQDTTGLEPKSIEVMHFIKLNQEDTYAPTTFYYVTVDTRHLVESEVVRTLGGKDLIREVNAMQHDSLGVILGAQHIKQQRRRK